jgi:drug/metabolite transporter (DMT)-like permease
MHFTKYQLAIIAIIANTILWSAASPILKWSLADAPPFALAFFRFLLATIIMFPFVIGKLKIRYEDLKKVFILSLVGITAHISLYYLGLSLAPSINAPIISATTPIFLIIGAIIFLHEKPKKKVLIGTLVSLIGVMIIIIRPLLGHVSVGSFTGNLYYVLATIAIVGYTILLKRYNLRYHFSTLVFWMFLFGTLALFPMYLIEMQSGLYLHLDFRGSIGIIYGAVFSSTLGYLFYNYGAKYLKAQEIGIFSYLETFITALVAIPLLGEKITFSYLLGALFVFAGIFIAENRLHYHPMHPIKHAHPEEKLPT